MAATLQLIEWNTRRLEGIGSNLPDSPVMFHAVAGPLGRKKSTDQADVELDLCGIQQRNSSLQGEFIMRLYCIGSYMARRDCSNICVVAQKKLQTVTHLRLISIVWPSFLLLIRCVALGSLI